MSAVIPNPSTPVDAPPPAPPSFSNRTSRIPLSYAAEVLRRRDEYGWSLRDLAGWLSKELQKDISHRTVDRFIRSQRKEAALEALRPLHERLKVEMEQITDSLGERRRILDDTDEELARRAQKSLEEIKTLEADHARELRSIRSLVAQFNAFGKHVPKPKADSLAVPVCTPASDRFTGPALSSSPAVPDHVQPPLAETSTQELDSRAVPVCTPDSNAFTQQDQTGEEKKPEVDSAAVPAGPPDWEDLDETEECGGPLPDVTVLGPRTDTTFAEWIASQPTALQGQPLAIDPRWFQSQSDAIFVDLVQGHESLGLALAMLRRRPEFEPLVVFLLPQNASSELEQLLPTRLNPPLRLPLTPEKVNAALASVEQAKLQWKQPLRRTG